MSSVNQPQDGVTSTPSGDEKRDEATQQATGPGPRRIELQVEELEERIAPRLAANHNETVLS